MIKSFDESYVINSIPFTYSYYSFKQIKAYFIFHLKKIINQECLNFNSLHKTLTKEVSFIECFSQSNEYTLSSEITALDMNNANDLYLDFVTLLINHNK